MKFMNIETNTVEHVLYQIEESYETGILDMVDEYLQDIVLDNTDEVLEQVKTIVKNKIGKKNMIDLNQLLEKSLFEIDKEVFNYEIYKHYSNITGQKIVSLYNKKLHENINSVSMTKYNKSPYLYFRYIDNRIDTKHGMINITYNILVNELLIKINGKYEIYNSKIHDNYHKCY